MKFILKKVGFTLSEVLITMGVVGVVAALTIPTLMNSYQKDTYITALHKAYNETDQALRQYMSNKGVEDLIEGGLNSEIDTWVTKYFKVTTTSTTKTDCFASSYDKINVEGFTGFADRPKYYTLASGASIAPLANVEGNKIMNIAVDTNGPKAPNTLGRDLFFFAIYRDGYIDDYKSGANAPLTTAQRDGDSCLSSTEKGSGWGCFGLILKNGWRMTY